MVGDRREFRREACVRCGLCAERCYAGALERIGREMTVGEVIEEVAKDRPFYDTSGGGMTVSGGEPLAQFAFTSALLVAARAAGLHTCLETAGFAPFERLAELRPNVDLFLYDYKETDPDRHRAHTGVPREGIVENLRRLDALGAAVVLRCPIVPGLNDRPDHFRGIAELANGLAAVREIHLLPYHPLGVSKSRRIGKAAHVHRDTLVDDALVAGWVAEVARLARLPVRRS
jgi:pyruvate formate lyase activating enzyme